MIIVRLLLVFLSLLPFFHLSGTSLDLISTESDPDAFIEHCVNVINGSYCEAATDLSIAGPDALIVQRFYDSGSWRIFPQRFLVVGKDPEKSSMMEKEPFEKIVAITGERSGGFLPYSGWRSKDGTIKNPLKIDIWHQAIGMVNSYAKEINGQTNHQNNELHCKGTYCELILGDGTKRIYNQVERLPSSILGEEAVPLIASQMIDPAYYQLVQEILPSGNQLFFSYDQKGHLTAVEMQNGSCSNLISWIHFIYDWDREKVRIETSDQRELIYQFTLTSGIYQLTHVSGSHSFPVSYEYDQGRLVKRILPEGRFVEVVYENGKVGALKGPDAQSGESEAIHTFSYGNDHTDAMDAMGIRTRYRYDKRLQLIAIEQYDASNQLYRIEQKFWGRNKNDAGLLLAKTIGDGKRIYSYRNFLYDKWGNVLEERLHGNLTGKQEISLQVSCEGKLLNPDEEECHLRTFSYSADGFNLLTKVGDCKENQTLYSYKPGTNLLLKKVIYESDKIKKRTFHHYNEEAVCIKTIEDDGSEEKESDLHNVTERHIQLIKPKPDFPGIGLPEIIEEKVLDLKAKKEILIKKLVNSYDSQSNLLSCATYY